MAARKKKAPAKRAASRKSSPKTSYKRKGKAISKKFGGATVYKATDGRLFTISKKKKGGKGGFANYLTREQAQALTGSARGYGPASKKVSAKGGRKASASKASPSKARKSSRKRMPPRSGQPVSGLKHKNRQVYVGVNGRPYVLAKNKDGKMGARPVSMSVLKKGASAGGKKASGKRAAANKGGRANKTVASKGTGETVQFTTRSGETVTINRGNKGKRRRSIIQTGRTRPGFSPKRTKSSGWNPSQRGQMVLAGRGPSGATWNGRPVYIAKNGQPYVKNANGTNRFVSRASL